MATRDSLVNGLNMGLTSSEAKLSVSDILSLYVVEISEKNEIPWLTVYVQYKIIII
jgi:hypothetical protein